MQKRIKLAFMRRLTHHLHAAYTSHHAYYSASTLGGAPVCVCGWGPPSTVILVKKVVAAAAALPAAAAAVHDCARSSAGALLLFQPASQREFPALISSCLCPALQVSRTPTSASQKMWSALHTLSVSRGNCCVRATGRAAACATWAASAAPSCICCRRP